MRKSLNETEESGEKDTSPKEIHDEREREGNFSVTDGSTVAQERQSVSL